MTEKHGESGTQEERLAEIKELRLQLKEAQNIISAIRDGEVDAMLISKPKGDQIYILQGADHVYREIVEEMQEGYITLSKDGVILFSNGKFAQMLRNRLEKVIGKSIYELLSPSETEIFRRSLTSADRFKREFSLNTADGLSVPVLVSANCFFAEHQFAYVIVTDLTEQKHNEQKFMHRVFDQAGESIIACDVTGCIVRANHIATKLFGTEILHHDFDHAIPLFREKDGTSFAIKDAMRGNISALETQYATRDNKERTFLISAGVLTGVEAEESLGFLVTLSDITDRKQAEKELAAVNHKIEVASIAKSRFLANMSHELRTPLNAIIGFSEVLQDKLFGPLNEKQKSYLMNIESSGKHLLTLVTDILDISKMEANKMDLDVDRLNLAELCQGALDMFGGKARKQSIALSYAMDSSMDGVAVVADRRKMKQILYNLVDNAIKFNHPYGSVSIRVQKASAVDQPSAVQISVEDTGVGIAGGDYAKLFLPFSQLAQSYYDKETEGTGLGLALTKHLVELHDGDIHVESEIGKGSRFIVRIPLRREPA